MKIKFAVLGIAPLILGCGPDEHHPVHKNVLFIMVDDMKPDIGCFGDKHAHTPYMDALGEESTIYSKAYCQQALSGPTRASLLTGLRPDETGVTELNTWMRKKNHDIITLPQAFREAGYETRSVGKIFHGEKNSLDSLSWSAAPSLYSYTKNDEYMLACNKTGKKAAACEFTDGPEERYLDVRIRNKALEELKDLASGCKPFFLAVGFLKPHLPFCAPKRFLDLYETVDMQADCGRITGAPDFAYHDSDELRGYTDIPQLGKISVEQNEYLKKAYYACISFTDDNIGMLISGLKELGLYENTVIVLAGDHGYHTGEQGLWCKSTNYEAACRAPLIIKDAGQKQKKEVGTPVEFIDIFPTLGEMCGVSVPANLSGKDLNSLEEGKEYYAISQFPRPYGALHKAKLRTHMGYTIRDSRWRYVEWYDNDGNLAATELYDLKDGGVEKENISGNVKYEAVRIRLSKELEKYLPREYMDGVHPSDTGLPSGRRSLKNLS